MAKHYRDAVVAIQRGLGDALDATYPGGLYDLPALEKLKAQQSRRPPLPIKPGHHRLIILEDCRAATLQAASTYAQTASGLFELIGATSALSDQLLAAWPYSTLFLKRVTLQPRFSASDLSAVAAACALRFARGGLRPFVAPHTDVATQVAGWAPGDSVVHLQNVPPYTGALPRPHVISLPGQPATGSAVQLRRTGLPEADAFIAAREDALAKHVDAPYLHRADRPLRLEIV